MGNYAISDCGLGIADLDMNAFRNYKNSYRPTSSKILRKILTVIF